jgi:hypothetical protein
MLGERIDDGVFILGAAPSVDAGFRTERPAVDDRRLAGRDGVLIKRRRIEIPMHRRKIFKSEFVCAVGAISQSRFLHNNLRLDVRLPPEPCV